MTVEEFEASKDAAVLKW